MVRSAPRRLDLNTDVQLARQTRGADLCDDRVRHCHERLIHGIWRQLTDEICLGGKAEIVRPNLVGDCKYPMAASACGTQLLIALMTPAVESRRGGIAEKPIKNVRGAGPGPEPSPQQATRAPTVVRMMALTAT
jgi:hypothetical protein